MTRVRLLLAATFAAVTTLSTVSAGGAYAAPGDLDTTYGSGGTVAFPGTADTSLQGTLLAAAPAASGGQHGTILAQNQTTYSPLGSTSQVVVRRLDSRGRVDPAYGTSGSTVLDLGQPAVVRDLAVTADAKVVLLMSIGDGSFEPQQVALARLLPTGQPDATFGSNGVAVEPSVDGRAPVAVLPRGGGAIVVGLAENGQGQSDFTTQTYDSHGAVLGALTTVDLGGYDVLTDLVAGPNGSYFAVGYSAKPSGQSAAAVKILRSGRPDPSYGTNGVVRIGSRGRGLVTVGAVKAGTSLLMYGSAQSGQDFDGFVAELTSTGVPLSTFGVHGLLVFGTPGALETVTAVAPSGPDAVVASTAVQGGQNSGLLTRLDVRTGAVDTSYGVDGTLALPDMSFTELLPNGAGMLMAGVRYASSGPEEIVQRRFTS